MSASLQRRVREMRSRVLARSWTYRQRRHAHGVWFRLRRVLVDASAAFVIPSDEAQRLVAEGHRPEPVGQELQPPKLMVFAPAERIAQIASTREIPVTLGAELLEAECLALTPFDVDPGRPG